MKKYLQTFLLGIILILASIGSLQAAEAPDAASAAASKRLLEAIEKNDFDEFIKDGEPAFLKLEEKQFEAVSKQLEGRMKDGYQVDYLGDMKQQGYHVTLWRLRFKDGGDDALATLSMKDGKVGGYWIK